MAARPKGRDAYALAEIQGRSEAAQLLTRAVADPQGLLRRLVLGEAVAERVVTSVRRACRATPRSRAPKPPTEDSP